MTETVGTQREPRQGGLRVERVYTTPGVHPYDEVTWQRRDVVMTNWRDGSVNFEQRGVEFPDFWSINATNIVTSKYFRGAVGSDTRESSLKQLVDRVVKTYRAGGEKYGYFASPEDAEVFEHELTWMLVHQVFSFNSPVWFNVGTPAPQQVSACFILAVDDTMDSILNWYREEGLIFKGGSGAGLNLSRIRSSKELLSSGGTASGPVSFMRGADASAGTIKSGGATRRAAKMVVLDVDHPDIGEFIETKRSRRRRSGSCATPASTWTSVERTSPASSTRTRTTPCGSPTSSCARSPTGRSSGCAARLDHSVIETVDARKLFRSMAQAAWECADPGIQYDDTINDWHTNPETGRITASNPCSEYMSLDNSSCNLASLNLMKFLREDGTFDGETFARAVEFVITAMDISISFADFPTEAIAETTRAYRQLGIGYANLGALLMATGHAYDSDGGRALAAAISSLMTGTAYRRSAELAGVVGPYDGYARNADAHQRVMRKHAAANDTVRPLGADDAALLSLAAAEWQRGLTVGAANGWRNAQASLLAPTGTIGFMMDCDTTGIEPDFSLVKFKKLVGGGSMQIVNQTVPRALRSLGYQEEQVEAIVEYISEHGHVVDAPGLRPEHYEVFDCAMGDAVDRADGARADDGGGAAVHVRRDLQDREHAGVGDGRGDRGDLPRRAGSSASRRWRSTATTARSGSRCRRRQVRRPRPSCGHVAAPVRRVPPGPQAAAEEAPVPDGVVLGGRRRGLRDGLVVPGRRHRRAVRQDVEAGLDPGRRDGRVLHRDLHRPAVRRAAGDVRLEVRQHALRAGRHDRRPGHPDRVLGHGLHVPPAGAGLPAVRAAGRARHLHRGRAGGDGQPSRTGRRPCPRSRPWRRCASPRPRSNAGAPASAEPHSSAELLELQQGTVADAPLCFTCGTKMRPAGSCYVCEGCGSTSGCS